MKLILIRHGKTEANEKHLYCGSTDLPLSKAGKTELLARTKETSYPTINGALILTSGMQRCEETLSILYGDIPHQTNAAFREMDFGAFEMHSYEELKNEPVYMTWITGDNEANITPGGESGNDMTKRVICGLKQLLTNEKDVLLITHGGVIAAIMTYLFPKEEKNRYEWQPKPGGGYSIDTVQRQYTSIF